MAGARSRSARPGGVLEAPWSRHGPPLPHPSRTGRAGQAGFRPPARGLRVGAHHGAYYCVGCCAGLMVVLIPLGVMNVAAMAALAVVIFAEKPWPGGGVLLGRALRVVLLVLAVLAPFPDMAAARAAAYGAAEGREATPSPGRPRPTAVRARCVSRRPPGTRAVQPW